MTNGGYTATLLGALATGGLGFHLGNKYEIVRKNGPQQNNTQGQTSQQNHTQGQVPQQNNTQRPAPQQNHTQGQTPQQNNAQRQTPQQNNTQGQTPQQNNGQGTTQQQPPKRIIGWSVSTTVAGALTTAAGATNGIASNNRATEIKKGLGIDGTTYVDPEKARTATAYVQALTDPELEAA